MIGTAITTAVYVVATVAIMGILSTEQLAGSSSPCADAAGVAFGGSWDKVIAAVAMVSAFGALNGWILLQGRVPLAAAEDGLFPKAFGRVHGQRKTPVFGLVVSSVLVTGLVFMNYTKSRVDQFTFVILLATLTTLVPYAYASAAQVVLMIREPERFERLRFVRDSVIAMLAFAYSVWAIAGAGKDIIANGFVLLMCGVPVYLYIYWRKSREEIVEAPPEIPPVVEQEKEVERELLPA